jgi:hypothetical protein
VQDDILKLALEVGEITESKIGSIDAVMRQARFLAINAHIEAARAGVHGAGFGVLADEMGGIAGTITGISAELRTALAGNSQRLQTVGADLMLAHKGERNMDLALNVIEILDRNLYERTCDVRWWATDSALVAAVTQQDARGFACERMAMILRSYTVYLDLVVVDTAGKYVACGRLDKYPKTLNTEATKASWFKPALQTGSSDEFVSGRVRRSPSLNDQPAATFAAAIREAGRPIGVLAVAFDWAPQTASIVKSALSQLGAQGGRVLILDADHKVLAASDDAGIFTETFALQATDKRGYYVENGRLIAYALTPGYETYAGQGWYGVVVVDL